MKKQYPMRNRTYSLMSILTELELRDGPALMLFTGSYPVQYSHLTYMQLLTIPKMAETQWTYYYETSEWVPVFHWAACNKVCIDNLFDHIEVCDVLMQREETWITPKGYPRNYNSLIPGEAN